MQTEYINFNALWLGQKAEQPSVRDLLAKLNAYKKKSRNRIIRSNLILILTALFISLIWYYYQPQFATTKIGIVVIIVAVLFVVISQNKSLVLFEKTNETESNHDYLKALLVIKEKQQFIQTTLLNLYFVLLSIGIALYMYEYTSRMSMIWTFTTYGIATLWMLFNWFYMRPQQIKKQQIQLHEMISKFENIQTHLVDGD